MQAMTDPHASTMDLLGHISTGTADGSVVVLLCGVAGSGKTTLAQRFEAAGFVRLSVDESLWASHGRYGLDYPADRYAEFSERAEAQIRLDLVHLIGEGRNVVVDLSFWSRRSRDEYKALIESVGGRWRLIHLKVDPAILRERLAARRSRFDANAAFPITDELLDRYLSGVRTAVRGRARSCWRGSSADLFV